MGVRLAPLLLLAACGTDPSLGGVDWSAPSGSSTGRRPTAAAVDDAIHATFMATFGTATATGWFDATICD
jgi:hypothetical protein